MSDIEKAINGDKEAFSRIIIQNKEAMYKTAIVILRNEDDAYDALQDALIKMYKNIQNLENTEAFKSWSRKVIINSCYNIINKNKKIIDINSRLINIYEEVREDTYECEDEVVKLLDKIEKDLRLTAILYYYNELSIKEISGMLNIPEGTVKSRLSRARQKLYEILKNERREINE